MIDEDRRKDIVLEHSRRLTAGDLDGLLDLYADGASLEDPVGSGPCTGRDAVRTHWERVIRAGTTEEPGVPAAGQDGLHALLPITAVADYLPLGPEYADRGWLTPPADPADKRLRRQYVLMIRTDAAGRIEDSKAFWGRLDIEVTS